MEPRWYLKTRPIERISGIFVLADSSLRKKYQCETEPDMEVQLMLLKDSSAQRKPKRK